MVPKNINISGHHDQILIHQMQFLKFQTTPADFAIWLESLFFTDFRQLNFREKINIFRENFIIKVP
jgi:hypothetical protein